MKISHSPSVFKIHGRLGFMSKNFEKLRRASGEPRAAPATWLVFAGLIIIGAVGYRVLRLLADWAGLPGRFAWLCISISGIISIIIVRSLYRRRRNRLITSLKANDFQLCLGCGYALGGLPQSHKCPGCGLDFELDHVTQQWQDWMAKTQYLG